MIKGQGGVTVLCLERQTSTQTIN